MTPSVSILLMKIILENQILPPFPRDRTAVCGVSLQDSINVGLLPVSSVAEGSLEILKRQVCLTRSLGALRAPTSSQWPFGPA